MSDLDSRTRNILNVLEHTLNKTKIHLDEQTHEAIVGSLSKATINVLESFRKYQNGEMTNSQYCKVLLKLAEITLMAVRKLPG